MHEGSLPICYGDRKLKLHVSHYSNSLHIKWNYSGCKKFVGVYLYVYKMAFQVESNEQFANCMSSKTMA